MKESYLQTQVMRWLKTQPSTWCYKAHDTYTSGIPDILGCHRGVMFAIELKGPNGYVSQLQWYCVDRIEVAGGMATVCRSLDEVKQFFAKVQERGQLLTDVVVAKENGRR